MDADCSGRMTRVTFDLIPRILQLAGKAKYFQVVQLQAAVVSILLVSNMSLPTW